MVAKGLSMQDIRGRCWEEEEEEEEESLFKADAGGGGKFIQGGGGGFIDCLYRVTERTKDAGMKYATVT